MRRPAGTGFCCPMISFTLETALGVSETGGVFFASGLTSGTVVFTSGTVVVAIRISLALKSLNYNRGGEPAAGRILRRTTRSLIIWMPGGCGRFLLAALANGSIMSALGPSPVEVAR